MARVHTEAVALSLVVRQEIRNGLMSIYKFKRTFQGRCGSVECADSVNVVDIDWEISGTSDYDILLAPLDLRQWKSGTPIPKNTQHDILNELRLWLIEQNIRSDVARPRRVSNSNGFCQRSGCSKQAIDGLMYCAFHYDENLLR